MSGGMIFGTHVKKSMNRCPDRRKIAVKEVDIFDNDTMTIVEVTVRGKKIRLLIFNSLGFEGVKYGKFTTIERLLLFYMPGTAASFASLRGTTMNELSPQNSEIILYRTEDGHTRIEVKFKGETAWLSLNQMAELFQRDKSVISKHIRNVFAEGELTEDSTVAKFATVEKEGSREVSREIEFYNLEVIISVGYRVKSHRGTQFRIWATERLREYIIKGFTLDDQRLKNAGGGNYFRELLARIRDIRTSEKVFWRQVLDIYATSIDYDPNEEITKQFFATVQNNIQFFWRLFIIDFCEITMY